eukprot:CAMPEP_0117757578 /NCGR_PEP_ID=MMETSP0947-20121206/14824_1 /TAXON_ID=44440 /ORGANISM="Chattonella subsalsa, Strain CCMP2191" /LENGTH=161 /DNA_ID=CAMNT_0005577517 /DNA_START=257 /DNA_END=742 /DNA_ORIENTATION=+
MEHLSNLYNYLDTKKKTPMVSFDQVRQLFLALCDIQKLGVNYINFVLQLLQEAIIKDGELGVSFEKFCASMQAAIMYEDLHEECMKFYESLTGDQEKSIPLDTLILSLTREASAAAVGEKNRAFQVESQVLESLKEMSSRKGSSREITVKDFSYHIFQYIL